MSLLTKIKAILILSRWKKNTRIAGCKGVRVHRSYQIESIYVDLYWSVTRHNDGKQTDREVFYTRCTFSALREEIRKNEESIRAQYAPF